MEAINPFYGQIPSELRERDQWVLMRHEAEGRKNEKLAKIPYQSNGTKASTTSPSTWASFEQVSEVFDGGNYDGIGFVFAQADPYVGVDLDRCRDPETGIVERWAQKIINRLETYTEVSVSGTGFHCYVKATLPPNGKKRDGGLEIYSSKRYFVVSGNRLKNTPGEIEYRQEQLDSLLQERGFLHSGQPSGSDYGIGYAAGVIFNPGAVVPVDVFDLIEHSESLQGLWVKDVMLRGQTDDSPSGYGQMLISQLALRGLQPQFLMDTLVDFRRRHGARFKSEDWYRREVSKAVQWAESQRGHQKQAGDDSFFRAIFRHWMEERSLLPIDLAVLMSLAQASTDGEHARRSVKDIANTIGKRVRYVQARLRTIEELGCIEVIEKERRSSPKKYRFSLAHHMASRTNSSSPHTHINGTNSSSPNEES